MESTSSDDELRICSLRRRRCMCSKETVVDGKSSDTLKLLDLTSMISSRRHHVAPSSINAFWMSTVHKPKKTNSACGTMSHSWISTKRLSNSSDFTFWNINVAFQMGFWVGADTSVRSTWPLNLKEISFNLNNFVLVIEMRTVGVWEAERQKERVRDRQKIHFNKIKLNFVGVRRLRPFCHFSFHYISVFSLFYYIYPCAVNTFSSEGRS